MYLSRSFSVANRLWRAGRLKEAITVLQQLQTDERRFSPEIPGSMTSVKLATWLGEVGRVEEAIGVLQQLLADELRVFGPDYTEALKTGDTSSIG